MYSVDDRDRVRELQDVPQSCVGAPFPLVLADEHRIVLSYLVNRVDPAWDGITVRAPGPEREGEQVALIEFPGVRAHYFGPPNDEASEGHPLASRGLQSYAAFEVFDSSWIREMERRNRVHPRHSARLFDGLRHFIFAFQDSMFECVARRYSVTLHAGPQIELLTEMRRKLTRDA